MIAFSLPDRIAVVDVDGKLAYLCGCGPRGGFDPETTGVAIKGLLANEGKWNGIQYPLKAPMVRRPP